MFWRVYPHGSASIAALAGGEIGANRQVCPTLVGGCVKLHPSRCGRGFFSLKSRSVIRKKW
jgi:hypothetical protein